VAWLGLVRGSATCASAVAAPSLHIDMVSPQKRTQMVVAKSDGSATGAKSTCTPTLSRVPTKIALDCLAMACRVLPRAAVYLHMRRDLCGL